MQFFYSFASKEGVQAKGETSSTHKENIQHFKIWNFLTGSRSGSENTEKKEQKMYFFEK